MSKSQEITIVAEGKTIKGEITFRNESDISLKITSPYSGLTGGLHIPYFSRPYHSFMADYGDRTAENLLKGLWELGSYMAEHREFLKLQLAFHFYHGDYADSECQTRFFDSSFPFCVPIGTQGDILLILTEGRLN
ncbi:MAG: hypothetical protein K9N35_11680 [Candidatus Marinimicrobia bacterium]|nr:hypothetical protein [Candidatus Neomarinimicrobiota bacterium]